MFPPVGQLRPRRSPPPRLPQRVTEKVAKIPTVDGAAATQGGIPGSNGFGPCWTREVSHGAAAGASTARTWSVQFRLPVRNVRRQQPAEGILRVDG